MTDMSSDAQLAVLEMLNMKRSVWKIKHRLIWCMIC